MKKIVLLLVLFTFLTGLFIISSDEAFAAWGRRRAKEKKEEEVNKAIAEAAEESSLAPEAKLIYTFKSDEEMTEFEQFYVSKQATFGRIGVLQAYFAMEQNNLAEIDRQMQEKFGFSMDPNKMYDLNRDSKEIREVGVIPAPVPAE